MTNDTDETCARCQQCQQLRDRDVPEHFFAFPYDFRVGMDRYCLRCWLGCDVD